MPLTYGGYIRADVYDDGPINPIAVMLVVAGILGGLIKLFGG